MMNIQIINIVSAVMFALEILFFYDIFFERRKINKINFVIYCFIAAGISVWKFYLDISAGINMCLSICLCMVMSIVFYRGTVINRLIAAIIFMVMAMLSEILAIYLLEFVLGVSYNEITVSTQLLFAPLSMAINIIILLYTKKIHRKQLANVPLKYLIPIMLIPIVSLSIILIVDKIIAFSNGYGEKLILPIVLMLLYVSFITFDFIENYSNKMQLELANEIIKKDRENYKILEENERELRDLRHDIRNHMQIIKSLKTKENDWKDIEEFVSDLENAVNKITSVSYTGNETLDSVLNIKGRRAKALSIKYFVKTNISSDIHISNIDLSTIMCNALDNAIDGALNTEDASIVIYIESNDEYVKVLIENTANEVIFVKGVVETTKKDKRNHGRGMKIIKTSVEKCDGVVSFDYDEGIFIVDINIPNKTGKCHPRQKNTIGDKII